MDESQIQELRRARLADAIQPAFVVYYLHLVFVWMLFAYLPWSKLGHFVYRTAALLFVRMYGRGY